MCLHPAVQLGRIGQSEQWGGSDAQPIHGRLVLGFYLSVVAARELRGRRYFDRVGASRIKVGRSDRSRASFGSASGDPSELHADVRESQFRLQVRHPEGILQMPMVRSTLAFTGIQGAGVRPAGSDSSSEGSGRLRLYVLREGASRPVGIIAIIAASRVTGPIRVRTGSVRVWPGSYEFKGYPYPRLRRRFWRAPLAPVS